MNEASLYIKLLEEFEIDRRQSGSTWRILKPDSIIDLLLESYFSLSKDHSTEAYFKTILLAYKGLINMRLGSIEVNDSLSTLAQIEEEKSKLENLFREITQEILTTIPTERTLLVNDSLGYIKTLSNLDLSNYTEQVFLEIIYSCLIRLKSGSN